MQNGPWQDEGVVQALLENVWGLAPYERSMLDLVDLQLQALAERLESRRSLIPVLEQRASYGGITTPSSLQDVVPLLFPHQAYKSYPQSFIDKGRWDGMNQWYDTLSAQEFADVDFAGVSDIDGWIGAMTRVGRGMHVTSGTTGKSGFLPLSECDRARNGELVAAALTNMFALPDGTKMPAFLLSAARGPRVPADVNQTIVQIFGDRDTTFFLFDEGERVSDINKIGAIRTAANNGMVRPSDLAEIQAIQLARREEFDRNLAKMADGLLEHIHRPVLIRGFWSQLLQFVSLLRERGVAPGSLAPGSIVFGSGGKKSDNLPEDFEQQIRDFFTGSRFVGLYSMSEILAYFYQCEQNRWHAPAHVLPLLLDEAGERAITPLDGVVQGRFALYDFSLHDRWGGIITSDWVTADFSRCPCGLASMSLVKIDRISLGTDDKLACAGTIDAYVRNIVGV